MSIPAAESRSFLDTIWARLIAAAIAIGGVAIFVSANWEGLVGGPDQALAGNPVYRECMAERMAAIETLRREANLSVRAYDLHRQRADAFCRQQAGAS
jgi:hypothetical protein